MSHENKNARLQRIAKIRAGADEQSTVGMFSDLIASTLYDIEAVARDNWVTRRVAELISPEWQDDAYL